MMRPLSQRLLLCLYLALSLSCSSSLRILLTNNNGYEDSGMPLLRDALVAAGHQVFVFSPSEQLQGASAALDLPIVNVTQITDQEWLVGGYAATAVLVGISEMTRNLNETMITTTTAPDTTTTTPAPTTTTTTAEVVTPNPSATATTGATTPNPTATSTTANPTVATTTAATSAPTAGATTGTAAPVETGAPSVAAPVETGAPSVAPPTEPPVTQVPSALGPFTDIYINAGFTGPYNDSTGQVWESDFENEYFTGGVNATNFGLPINGTVDDPIYQSERFAIQIIYTIDLPPGPYEVELHFAETFWTSPGARVFNISLQGEVVTQDLDVFAASGGLGVALVETYPVVIDGDSPLLIELLASVDQSKISGIVVKTAPTAAAQTELRRRDRKPHEGMRRRLQQGIPPGAIVVDGFEPGELAKDESEEEPPLPVDLIISGINDGFTSGTQDWHSGTLGGALTGLSKGIPSLAVLTDSPNFEGDETRKDAYFTNVANFVVKLVSTLEDVFPEFPVGVGLKMIYPQSEAVTNLRGVALAGNNNYFFVTFDYVMSDSVPNQLEANIISLDAPDPTDPTSDTVLVRDGFITCLPIQSDISMQATRYNENFLGGLRIILESMDPF